MMNIDRSRFVIWDSEGPLRMPRPPPPQHCYQYYLVVEMFHPPTHTVGPHDHNNFEEEISCQGEKYILS